MQNFTFGRKGTNWFLFAFVMLIGTLPSFGQEACPSLGNSDPADFCYLDDIDDLTTDTGAANDVVWYRDAAMTQPIPSNELLEDNTTYYAGNAEGDCTNPTPVTVTVGTIPAPDSSYGTVFSPYVASENETHTIEDLIEIITPNAGGQIFVYKTEFGTETYAETDELVAGQSYFVGQTSSTGTCDYSFRIAIRYSPDVAPAPDAVSPQEFCAGATVADLEATGTSEDTQAFRWYSTATSNPALEEDEELMSGTYYVSQIVNDEGSPFPPVESEARTEVTVEVTPLNFTEETQRFCESIGEGNDFRQPEVQDLSPAGDWFADSNSTEPLDINTELIDGEDYFNRDTGDECSQLRVTAEFFPTPNAGSTTQVEFCDNETAVNLVDYIEDSQLGAPDQTGYFSPALSTGTNMFDPSDYEPGVYNFTYIVEGNEDCPTDTSSIQVTVQAAPNAGDDIDESICSSELENPTALIAEFSSYLEGRDQNGTFDDLSTVEVEKYTVEDVAQTILFSEASVSFSTYSFAYNVENDAGCEASANIELTVLESPDAGENGSIEFTREDDPVNLFDYLGGTPDEDGVWSPGNQNGDFDPATGNAGTYTYTVSSTNGCEDSAIVSVSFENEPIECPVVTESEQAFCESIGEGNNSKKPTVSDLLPTNAVWYSTADSEIPLADDTFLEDGETYFAGNINGTCEDRDSVTVTLDDSPNAGATTTLNICDNAEAFDIVDVLNESILGQADAGGTITPALASGTTIFDPAVDTSGTYTYTVSSTNGACPDDKAVIYINFLESPDAGDDLALEYCITEIENMTEEQVLAIFNSLTEDREEGGEFSDDPMDLYADYLINPIGTFETTYTVENQNCSDSAELSLTISDTEEANAGDDIEVTFCSTDGLQDLTEFLSEDAIRGGSFEGLEGSIFDPSTADLNDPTTIIYTVNVDNACVTGEDSATFTITVLETVTAGEDMTASFCATDGEQDLFNFLDEEASADGEFTYNDEVLVDGMFDASTMGVGSYEVTYTVEPINECGVATSTLTVTVNEVPDAPAAPELDAFCAIEMATGADLPMAEGQTWYADAELTTMVAAEDLLEDGTYYLTVTSENGCESEATEVTVTVNDSPAPTISSTNLEFCDADNPTIADLNAEIAESGEITWYDSEDGTNALGTSTTLTSGTYYATLTGETGCESTERLVVTVSVENCPIVYPEIITPNNDNKNDTFIIKNITNEYPNYSIEIFNRWGNVIYKGNASTPAWDGTSNQSGSFGDDVLPVGVYFYVIDFNDGSTEPKQGKVYLSR